MSRKSSLFLFLSLTVLALPVISYAQSANDGFNPNANASVESFAVQEDGKILIGGSFTTIGGVARNGMARLNPDGSLDTGFNPNPDSYVQAIALQTDGKILIGGNFTTIGGVATPYIARLNSNGSLDTGFNPNANTRVTSIAVQADGKILIGAGFITTTIDPRSPRRPPTIKAISVLARLNPDGSLDTTFNPNANSAVNSIRVQADGKILIAGYFTTVGGVGRNYMARLNPDGSLDAGFDPNPNGFVSSITLHGNGKILIGGEFTTIGGVARNRIARLNLNGSLDTTFNPNADGTVNSIAVQAGGKILIGGQFTTIGGVGRNHIARLYYDGSLDTDFNPDANEFVYSIAVQADGKILIGGKFTSIGGVARNQIARLNPSGSLDAGFNPNASGSVYSIALQADGKILVGGEFTTSHIARLNPSGSLDAGFNPNVSGVLFSIASIAVQADGKILIGGNFATIGGVGRINIARLNPDGSLDTTFNPNANGYVISIAVQADGKILIGGKFTTIGGVARNHIARLNPDGSLDTGFNPNVSGGKYYTDVYSVAVQADGKILIGGNFTTIGGVGRNYIARLDPSGSLDATFNPDANNLVRSIAVQADGKILVGGDFNAIGGMLRNRIARLKPDGTGDTTFNSDANYHIFSIALQADGKILIGGDFNAIGGVGRNYIARLTNTDAALQELKVSPTGSTVTWLRGRTSPEVWRVTFEHSSDGINWSSLGNGTRIAGGWQLTGLSLPYNQNHWVRVRGYASSSPFSLYESVRMFYNPTRPELIETAVSNPPANAAAGSNFSVTDTVKNQGNASAIASITRYYLSLDTTKGSGDILLTGSRSVPALGINGMNTGSVTVTIPSNTPAGSYYLLACADDTQGVVEFYETNNCIASASKVNVTR
jgi:uncharacterized delta-60 repeat protein